jgi:hypothetical protein
MCKYREGCKRHLTLEAACGLLSRDQCSVFVVCKKNLNACILYMLQNSSSHRYTLRSESRCALRLRYVDTDIHCVRTAARRFGCQYRSCRCSVLLFHCIQLLNSG